MLQQFSHLENQNGMDWIRYNSRRIYCSDSFTSCSNKTAVIIIFWIACIAIGKAQYMPLDVSEMQYRTHTGIQNSRSNEIQEDHNKIDVSLLFDEGLSIFVVPSLRIQISEHIDLYNRFILTTNSNYGPRIGSRYERSGNFTGPKKPGDASIIESNLYYSGKSISLKVGKMFPAFQTPSRKDIFNNYQLPSAFGIMYSFQLERVSYMHGYYSLGYSSEGDNAIGLNRYYAIQQLCVTLGRYKLVAGNRVLYAGSNQSIKLKYFTPLEPFVISVFNAGAPINNDNHVIDFGIFLDNPAGYEISAKLIIDEFEVDSADRKTDDDDWGLQLQFSKSMKDFWLSRVTISYFYSSDYLGIHRGNSINYEMNGIPVFSEYGPQVKRLDIINYLESDKINTFGWISFYIQSKGNHSILGTDWAPKATQDDLSSWMLSKGVEGEFLVQALKNYSTFLYFNIDDEFGMVVKLSLAHSFYL